jgi:hypothetical protein
MFKKITRILSPLCLVVLPAFVNAGSDVWYVTPEDHGDCGEECYTAPAAWIDNTYGKFRFGVSCGSMIMSGPAMEVSQPPFSIVEMFIDRQSYGYFNVHNGMQDTYVSPTIPDWQTPSRIQAALNSGGALRFMIKAPEYGQINFKLSGSRSAIALMNKACPRY